MPIMANRAGKKFELAPEAMHVARCFQIIDCGTHWNEKWKKDERIVRVYFELPTARRLEDGEPHRVSVRYTVSLHPKSRLRRDLESWNGKRFDDRELEMTGGFDLEKLLGQPAMLNVVHSEDGLYANITSVNPLPTGTVCPDRINATVSLSLDSEDFDVEVFEGLPEGLQEWIAESPEYKQLSDTPSVEPDEPVSAAGPNDDPMPDTIAPF